MFSILIIAQAYLTAYFAGSLGFCCLRFVGFSAKKCLRFRRPLSTPPPPAHQVFLEIHNLIEKSASTPLRFSSQSLRCSIGCLGLKRTQFQGVLVDPS